MVETGACRLVSSGFAPLRGKRAGLIANHTSFAGEHHLADLLHDAPDVRLIRIFSPEHGFRGRAEAGAKVRDGRDAKTGVPVVSLYGASRSPRLRDLEDLDVLVFDLQDAGVRYYTYISTMGLAMQAAARAGIEFMVLDRPNPLGGKRMAGFVAAKAHRSFVAQYPIPLRHGLTTGELARMIKGEAMLPGLDRLGLNVVKLRGWRRDMLWPETGLAWPAPSPNLADFETTLAYAGTGLIEGVAVSEGRGTHKPFLQFGAPWLDGGALAKRLRAAALPGVSFAPARFTPRPIKSKAAAPKFKGRAIAGVRLKITDAAVFRPVETGIHVLSALYRAVPASKRKSFFAPAGWLTKLAGTRRLETALGRAVPPEKIITRWAREIDRFAERRKPYLLYD